MPGQAALLAGLFASSWAGRLFLLRRMKTDAASLGSGWWFHELTDCLDHMNELLVVVAHAAFELVQPAGQVGVRGEVFPQTDKGSHDFDVDLHGPFAAQVCRPYRA